MKFILFSLIILISLLAGCTAQPETPSASADLSTPEKSLAAFVSAINAKDANTFDKLFVTQEDLKDIKFWGSYSSAFTRDLRDYYRTILFSNSPFTYSLVPKLSSYDRGVLQKGAVELNNSEEHAYVFLWFAFVNDSNDWKIVSSKPAPIVSGRAMHVLDSLIFLSGAYENKIVLLVKGEKFNILQGQKLDIQKAEVYVDNRLMCSSEEIDVIERLFDKTTQIEIPCPKRDIGKDTYIDVILVDNKGQIRIKIWHQKSPALIITK